MKKNIIISNGVAHHEVSFPTVAEAKAFRFVGASEVWMPSRGVVADPVQPLPAAVVETFYRPGIGMVTQEVTK
jgi:hypothetical protein